jgi:branched-chain amino acid transport system ATP-binding protein
MLEICDLHSYYGEAYVLRGLGLSVPEGKVIALLGRNGMGKTTLIRSIMGLRPPTVRKGSICFRGQPLTGKSPNQIARLGIGLVPQGRRVFPSLTVSEHLDICPQRATLSGRTAWTRDRLFQLFPRLAERRGHRGQQLSGGERQMLAIARALMLNPDLILMDEPTEGLAPVMVKHVEQAVQTMRAEGISILLVEQNLLSALAVADLVHILEVGSIVFSGLPSELAANKALMHRHLGV